MRSGGKRGGEVIPKRSALTALGEKGVEVLGERFEGSGGGEP